MLSTLLLVQRHLHYFFVYAGCLLFTLCLLTARSSKILAAVVILAVIDDYRFCLYQQRIIFKYRLLNYSVYMLQCSNAAVHGQMKCHAFPMPVRMEDYTACCTPAMPPPTYPPLQGGDSAGCSNRLAISYYYNL